MSKPSNERIYKVNLEKNSLEITQLKKYNNLSNNKKHSCNLYKIE